MDAAAGPTETSARLVETHTAVLVFLGDRVYKCKKAADLGFLDNRTREARLEACRAEVELNGRLAPDVYLGVLDVLDPSGAPCDHLVAMRRMPDDRRLTRCIERGEDLDSTLRSIAHAITTLHAASPRDEAREHDAEATAVRRRWTDGFDQLRPLAHLVDRPDRLEASERLVLRYLDGRRPLFARRIGDGRIRDGHGDLQAEDIFVLPDGPRILDCIEFGAEYRWGDELSDVAFLAMDLERLGRTDLATRFLGLHRELTADRWPVSLAHHYIAYRAHVRAKVGVLKAHQRGTRADAEVDALLDLSLRHLERAQPRMVVVGGLPGTGKSTLAAGMADRLGAVLLRTDEVRRRMPATSPATGRLRYSPDAVAAVYHELLAEAQTLLGLGEHVVLDATWSLEPKRRLARAIAQETASDIVEVECTVDRDIAAQRIQRRRRFGEDPSEATPAVAAAMSETFAPWPQAHRVSTEPPPDLVLREAMASCDLRAEVDGP